MGSKKEKRYGYDITYNADGTEQVIDLSKIAHPNYSNVTVTSGGLTSGSGLTYTTGTSATWMPLNGTSGTIQAKDFILDGISLKEILEERLNMLVPNPNLEKEWDDLKKLGDRYRKLEKELQEKSKMWKALKKV